MIQGSSYVHIIAMFIFCEHKQDQGFFVAG